MHREFVSCLLVSAIAYSWGVGCHIVGCGCVLVWRRLHQPKQTLGRKGEALSIQTPPPSGAVFEMGTVLCPASAVIPDAFCSMLVEFQAAASRRKGLGQAERWHRGPVGPGCHGGFWALLGTEGCVPWNCAFPGLGLGVYSYTFQGASSLTSSSSTPLSYTRG